MKRWLLFLIVAMEVAIVLAVVYFEPSYQVRGTLWNEAFYDGKPTSWWRADLTRWNVIEFRTVSRAHHRYGTNWRFYVRKPTCLEELGAKIRNEEQSALWEDGPTLLQGDASALPVLHALQDDPRPEVRQFVAIGLERMPKKN